MGRNDRNYCLNPAAARKEGEGSVWCYTMDKDQEWEFCEPLASVSKQTVGVVHEDAKGTGTCNSIEDCASKCLDSTTCTAFDFDTNGQSGT